NGEIDGGDRIGYYSVDEDDYPSAVTINEGTLEGIDIGFHMDVMEPSGIPMSLKGIFTRPSGYDEDAPPAYVIVAKVDYPDILLNDPISAIKYFEKMPPGEFTFNIDLSETDLMPGDEVMVIALWDRDYEGGFPKPTRGDKLGIVQNKDKYAFTVQLRYGVNAIPGDGYEFRLSKRMYDFDSSILYALDMSQAGSFDPDLAQIIVMALHVDGLKVSFQFPNIVDIAVDMDYVLAFRTLAATEYDYIGDGTQVDPNPPRVLDILTALFEDITVYEESEPPDPLIKGENVAGAGEQTAYLVAILDKDGDGEFDPGSDEIGYYSSGAVTIDGTGTITIPGLGDITVPDWFPTELFGQYCLPTALERITKGDNLQDRGGGVYGPYWIQMNKYWEPSSTP
ncbi:MAG: hypothetical protein NT072_09995, partial [Deltaproteobacteria bacterium]|nr:hypothetical protein [Deltaproteobacteria bacterium]